MEKYERPGQAHSNHQITFQTEAIAVYQGITFGMTGFGSHSLQKIFVTALKGNKPLYNVSHRATYRYKVTFKQKDFP